MFNPEEFGMPSEETSNPVSDVDIQQMVAHGRQIASQAHNPQVVDQRRALAARQARATQPAAQAPQQEQLTPMEEIEFRFELGSYYRALLANPMFDDQDDFSSIVENEVRGFIVSRLQELMGTGKPKSAQPAVEVRYQFTDDEAQVLKLMAGKLMEPKAPSKPQETGLYAIGARLPNKEEYALTAQPAAPTVAAFSQPPSQPKVRKAGRPKKVAVAQAEAPAPKAVVQSQIPPGLKKSKPAEAAVSTPAEAPMLPIPMPRGQNMTSVSAMKASEAMSETENTFNNVLRGK